MITHRPQNSITFYPPSFSFSIHLSHPLPLPHYQMLRVPCLQVYVSQMMMFVLVFGFSVLLFLLSVLPASLLVVVISILFQPLSRQLNPVPSIK